MISLRELAFGFGARTLFDGLSLEIARGSLCAVVGPNGAGKSTLLRLVLGLLTPQRGAVRVDDVDVATLPRRQVARHVAALLQDEPLVFPMTAQAHVLLGRVAHLPGHGFETSADLDAAKAAMDEVGVMALSERMLDTLSGGERRRVLLARAFAQGAPVLVLDEPAANLDLEHQLELFATLRRRADAGATILVSVHDLNLAARTCDRVVIVDGKGGVVAGAPRDVLSKARIAEVFSVDVAIADVDGAPYYVPLRPTR